ncbi:MAG: hypothetical protein CSA58_02655 [Micrococcales bacterium]|nr:MAG: hypothetical protein CSB46_01650 [Micrococcales bacterium]PIE27734.1 MAG: hypothetical protein CSA58_02655 [Micrococcales bacterium]
MIRTVISSVLVLSGVGLVLLAAIGLLRFPDALTRMHAQTKPTVLGFLLLIAGVAVDTWDLRMTGPLILVALLQVLTAPAGAHMIGRAAHRDLGFTPILVRDDLAARDRVVTDAPDTDAQQRRPTDP